ncbi:hypothetical protein T492DRAFT_1053574, partial [Pavlovales sp. CCMP2436]
LLLARLSALAPIAAQRPLTRAFLNAWARWRPIFTHYRRSIGTRGGAQASAAD